MRITLIAPSLYRRADGEKIGKGFSYPPMGLLVVAALTPPHHSVTLIDENTKAVDYDEEADLVGLSVTTPTAPRAYEIAARFRARGVKVVMGGIHPTVLPDEAAQFADAVVIGEAEGVWQRLLEDAERGRLKRFYKADSLPDPSLIPTPRYDLLPRNGYWVKSMIHTTRGCPFNCAFCSVTRFFGGTFRTRPVNAVIQEIRKLKSKFIGFVDDNIIGNRRYAYELFSALVRERIYWAGQASVNVVRDRKLLKLLRKSGCKGLFIGFESVSQESLKEAGKRQNRVREYKEAIKILHDHGITVEGAFIFGFDSDDESVFERTLEFCFSSGVDLVQFSILTPFPGTRLYDRLNSEGRILTRDWSRYNMSNVVFRPAKMSAERLYEGWLSAYRRFYGRWAIVRRLLSLRRRAPFALIPLLVLNLTYRRRLYKRDETPHSTPPLLDLPESVEVLK